MFEELADAVERHYCLHYYLYLVGWHPAPPPQPGGVEVMRAVRLRFMAREAALAWIARQAGPAVIIEFPAPPNAKEPK